jgi:LuxR family maltose regulon positive regulatory protein
VKSYLMLAKLEQARGNAPKAEDAFQAGEKIFHTHPFSSRQSAGLIDKIGSYWILQGNPEKVVHLLHQAGISFESVQNQAGISYLQEPEMMLLLRLLLAQGEFDTGLLLAKRLSLQAETGKRTGRLIEIWILQALAYQSKKDIDQALAVLDQALELGQMKGYIRTFLDQGEPMMKLLYQARARKIGSGYASKLLAAVGKDEGRALAPIQLLAESLTSREIEVLKLIESGQSNQEIAEKLVISLPTVKRHISNIYTKLGATSRTQAVLLARELGLL